jgi:hypothetical protein
MNAFINEYVRLRFFGKILLKDTLIRYKILSIDVAKNWDKLFVAFIISFYPENRTYGARCVIINFKHLLNVDLIKCYRRFYCPHR